MTKWVILAGVILTFLTAVFGAWQAWLNRRRIEEVHVLVNSNMTKVLDRLGVSQGRSAQLEGSMKDAGMEVPDPPA
jgi:uncharacterized membrane protein